MICKEGVSSLTMEKLAARLPFSKGTLYNHFASREDLLVALSVRCVELHRDTFARVATMPGRTRERFCALGMACCTLEEGSDMDVPVLINESLLAQGSPEKVQAFRHAYEATIGVIAGIVRDAIASGDMEDRWQPEFVAFTTWALHFGSEDLFSRGVIFRGHSDEAFRREQQVMAATLLDGFGWKPLSRELDYADIERRVMAHLAERPIACRSKKGR